MNRVNHRRVRRSERPRSVTAILQLLAQNADALGRVSARDRPRLFSLFPTLGLLFSQFPAHRRGGGERLLADVGLGHRRQIAFFRCLHRFSPFPWFLNVGGETLHFGENEEERAIGRRTCAKAKSSLIYLVKLNQVFFPRVT